MVKKTNKRRKGLRYNRVIDTDKCVIGDSICCLQGFIPYLNRTGRKSGRKHRKGFRVRILNQKGTSSLEFLIYFVLIVFILFAGVDYFVTLTRIQMVEHEKNFYLDRIKIEGVLTDNSRQQMFTGLTEMGFKNIEITTQKHDGTILDGETPVYRNIAYPNDSLIELTVKAEPKEEPFLFGRLLGSNTDKTFYIEKKGAVLSEKPKPD